MRHSKKLHRSIAAKHAKLDSDSHNVYACITEVQYVKALMESSIQSTDGRYSVLTFIDGSILNVRNCK